MADAAASTAFIAGAEPREVRQRYEQAITNAAVALTQASSGLTDAPMQELLSQINARLAEYAGLVETRGRTIGPVTRSARRICPRRRR